MTKNILFLCAFLMAIPALAQVAPQMSLDQAPVAGCRRLAIRDPFNAALNKTVTLGCAVDGAVDLRSRQSTSETTVVGANAFTFDKGLQIGGGVAANGALGTMLRNDGHRDWIALMPRPDPAHGSAIEAVEFAINGGTPFSYTASGSNVTMGVGQSLPPKAAGARVILENAAYAIVSVAAGGNSFTVVGTPAPAGLGVYAPTRGTGVGTINGTTFTRVTGDPLTPFAGTSFQLRLNGTLRPVSSLAGAPDSYVLSSAPGDATNIAYEWSTTINDQISTLRVARIWGSNEENVSLYAAADGYHLQALYGGEGKYRKLFVGSGEVAAGTLAQQIVLQTNGDLSMGWDYGGEAIRVLNQVGGVNRLETQAAMSGGDVSWRARSDVDADVGMTLDMKGLGGLTITNGSFTRILGKFNSTPDAHDFPELVAANGRVALLAKGLSADIDWVVETKGGGSLRPANDNETALGEAAARWSASYAAKHCYTATICDWSGAGSPEGAIGASVGSTYRRSDGEAGTAFYVKESGTGNMGWVAK